MSEELSLNDFEQQARALFAQGEFTEAEILFRAFAEGMPENPAAHYNLGVTLAKLDRFEEAIGCYRQAIELNPSFSEAYANFGFCLNAFNLVAQARQAFHIARELTPEDPVPALNEGIAALALGDYLPGWEGFAARWQLPAYAKFKRNFDQPIWEGQDIAGKTLFLYCEQGFGDTVQMARFIPLLIEKGINVIVEVPPALVTLIDSVSPSVTVIAQRDPIPDFDFYCAMMDVPGALGLELSQIPYEAPYLLADQALSQQYIQDYPRSKKLRIGIAWAGRSSHENDRNRSLSFDQLAPLLELPNIEWVSLQRIVPDQDVAAFSASDMMNWGEGFSDFSYTAAAIEALDLVISVDTAIAHLAGALGKDVFVLLPFYADWRWLMQRDDSPWYPTAELLRQKARGNWEEVIDRLAKLLP